MRIRNLDTFYWIASLGSFRAAANKLHLTQPAISARIQVLEQDLGAEVFLHELRNAQLTPAGRKLFVFSEKLVQLEQDVLSAFRDTSTIEQTIRVGTSETVIATWLPEFIGRFGQHRPKLTFDLRVDSTDNLKNALVGREIDLALLMGPVTEAGITNQHICAYDMVFAACKSTAYKHVQWGVAEILHETILTFASNTKPYHLLKELLSSEYQQPRITTSTSLGAIIHLAIAGMGICVVPRVVIKKELGAGQLVKLATNLELTPIAFTASYITQSPLSDLIRCISRDVVAFLQENTTSIFD